jgi:hypothetical protein
LFIARQKNFINTTKKERLSEEDLALLERVEKTFTQFIDSIKHIKDQNDWHNSDF